MANGTNEKEQYGAAIHLQENEGSSSHRAVTRTGIELEWFKRDG